MGHVYWSFIKCLIRARFMKADPLNIVYLLNEFGSAMKKIDFKLINFVKFI